MTPVWHDGPLAAIDPAARAVVWALADEGPMARQAAARALVAHLAGGEADCVRLARDVEGAPRVASPGGWHISLSRRDGICLVAAAAVPIAVDREIVDAAPPLWDMLTADEAAAVRALPAPERPRAWLRRWTIKEAHAKLVGTPRRLAAEAIATRLVDAVHATAECHGRSRCWTRDTGTAIETVAIWAADAGGMA
ncbi:4'-phosphopantetheinyl transferase family protein [Sphingomonas sp. XXL09]|uniref:4'-phosphopantetheinyl transferase family protein n=1 Tax=Sphingomonas sp. XXL09 TaxID=3457787 RepID=UPI00406BC4D2